MVGSSTSFSNSSGSSSSGGEGGRVVGNGGVDSGTNSGSSSCCGIGIPEKGIINHHYHLGEEPAYSLWYNNGLEYAENTSLNIFFYGMHLAGQSKAQRSVITSHHTN